MTAKLIDGKAIAADVRREAAEETAALKASHRAGRPPWPPCWWAKTRPHRPTSRSEGQGL